MLFFWMILGALIASGIWFVFLKLQAKGKMSFSSWLSAICAILMGAFTLAWAVASWMENEIQAAGMGLLIFGVITLIFLILTRKLIINKVNKRPEATTALK